MNEPVEAPQIERRERLRSLVAAARAQAERGGSSAQARHGLPSAAVGLRSDALEGYEILGELHRGGQGVVYEAVQKSVGRRVAVKVLRQGPFADEADRRRFEREIHILGVLRHPGIVAIHDSGVAAGCYFFVMDYVEGASLDHWAAAWNRECGAARSALSPRDAIQAALRLFLEICEAVNAAHVLGIVHRDLKPSNIRVDSCGKPRVLDFGLAKPLERIAGGSAAPQMTLTGQFVGSVPWASPEQARGESDRIDARSDVYSLGVVLYQLLTGRFPYGVTGPLATTLSAIQHQAPIPPRNVRREIDDDVQTIVLRCLAKEPERRYESAGALAADLGRFLAGEPIAARRDALGYVLWKAARRHRAAVLAGSSIFLLIAAGLIVSLTFWRNAAAERDRAKRAEEISETRRAQAEAVNAFLNDDLLASVAPSVEAGRGKDVKMREVLDAASERIEGRFADQPEVEATVRSALGETYLRLAQYDAAERHLLRCLALRRQALGDEDRATLSAMNELAILYALQGRFAESERMRIELGATTRRLMGDKHPDTLVCIHNLGELYTNMGRYADAERCLTEALEGQSDVLGREHPSTLLTQARLARAYYSMQRHKPAEETLMPALEAQRRILGAEHADTQGSVNLLTAIYQATGRFAECEPMGREQLALRRRTLGDDHPLTLQSMGNLAVTLLNLGRSAEAEALFKSVNEANDRVGRENVWTLTSKARYAEFCFDQGRIEQSEALLRETLAGMQRALDDGNPETLSVRVGLSQVCLAQGRPEEAEMHLNEAIAAVRRTKPPGDPSISALGAFLAPVLLQEGKYAGAESLLRECLEIRRASLPAGDPRLCSMLPLLGEALLGQAKFDESERVLLEGYERQEQDAHAAPADQRKLLELLVKLYDKWNSAEGRSGKAAESARWRSELAEFDAAVDKRNTGSASP